MFDRRASDPLLVRGARAFLALWGRRTEARSVREERVFFAAGATKRGRVEVAPF